MVQAARLRTTDGVLIAETNTCYMGFIGFIGDIQGLGLYRDYVEVIGVNRVLV